MSVKSFVVIQGPGAKLSSIWDVVNKGQNVDLLAMIPDAARGGETGGLIVEDKRFAADGDNAIISFEVVSSSSLNTDVLRQLTATFGGVAVGIGHTDGGLRLCGYTLIINGSVVTSSSSITRFLPSSTEVHSDVYEEVVSDMVDIHKEQCIRKLNNAV